MGMSSASLQEKVVSMYERHPFPSVDDPFRKTAEEMGLRLKMLGLRNEEFTKKKILDAGCGTGEYTCWFASRGNDMTGIDLSLPSLELARKYGQRNGFGQIQFERQSVLDLQFPDNSFDLTYSMGVLHHTPDPYRGFQEIVRVTKPGGIVIVSVYNRFGRLPHNMRQKWINWLAGEDQDRRVQLAKIWFPKTCRQLKARMRSDADTILYDAFGIPHESQHTIGELLRWFDKNNVEYMGAFGPATLRDNILALQQQEYKKFEESLEAFPLAQKVGGMMSYVGGLLKNPGNDKQFVFTRPSGFSRGMVQLGWFILGFRFSIFSLSGRKGLKNMIT